MRREVDSQVLIAIVGSLTTILVGVGSWIGGRRRGQVEASTLASADNREWAAVFLARLTATEGKLDTAEAELESERQAHAATRDRLAGAERRITELEREMVAERAERQREMAALIKEVRRLGGHVPGETPAHGTPAVTPPEVTP